MEEENHRLSRPVYRRLGWICLTLIIALGTPSIPLHCTGVALSVGGVSMLAGGMLGAALAMVTRSRRPIHIYFWLAIAALTFFPLYHGWPPGDSFDILPWRGAPEIVYNYFDILRGGAYLLAMPYPFARLGQHAPDPLPPGGDKSG